MYRRIGLNISCILLALVALQLSSCKEAPKKIPLLDSFTGYCEQSTSTIISGKLHFNDLLKDLSYTEIPKLNEILTKELNQLKKGINLDEPIFFCVDSLLDPNGIPTDLKLFIPLKNNDSIVDQLRAYGLFVNQNDSLNYVLKDHLAIGVKEKIMVIHYSINNSLKSLQKTFRQLQQPVSGTKLHRLLSNKSSISLNVHLKEIVALLNPEHTLSKNSAFHNSYVQNTINLQPGKIVGNTRFEFSETLKNRLFFQTKSSNEFPFQRISSNMIAGLRIHLLPTKLETLLEDYFPQLITKWASHSTEFQLALLALGEKPIQSLLSGDIEIRLTDKNHLLTPEYTVGLGNKKENIAQIINAPSFSGLPFYVANHQLCSKEQSPLGQQPMIQTLQPKNAYSLFGFIDFNKLYQLNSNDPITAGFKALHYFQIWGDNQSITWKIQAKSKKQGILYQIVMQYYAVLEQQMSESQLVF